MKSLKFKLLGCRKEDVLIDVSFIVEKRVSIRSPTTSAAGYASAERSSGSGTTCRDRACRRDGRCGDGKVLCGKEEATLAISRDIGLVSAAEVVRPREVVVAELRLGVDGDETEDEETDGQLHFLQYTCLQR